MKRNAAVCARIERVCCSAGHFFSTNRYRLRLLCFKCQDCFGILRSLLFVFNCEEYIVAHELQVIPRLTLTPKGHLHIVQQVDLDDDNAQVHQSQVIHAFAHSQEEGLLQLVSSKIDSSWSLAMKYWRNYIAQYVDKLCHYTADEQHFIDKIKAPNEENLQIW